MKVVKSAWRRKSHPSHRSRSAACLCSCRFFLAARPGSREARRFCACGFPVFLAWFGPPPSGDAPGHYAYHALEKLVTPLYAIEVDEGVAPSRAELGSLLRIVNAELQQMVNQLSDTTALLQTISMGQVSSP